MENDDDKKEKITKEEGYARWVDTIVDKSGGVQEAVELVQKERKTYLLLSFLPLLIRPFYEIYALAPGYFPRHHIRTCKGKRTDQGAGKH
jgi:hypothetical protein